MLTKEWIFVLKTYYATRSYLSVKVAFHTEFLNSATTSDSSILLLARKFEEAGNIQDKLWKERLHTAMTTERIEEVCKFVSQNIPSICCNNFV